MENYLKVPNFAKKKYETYMRIKTYNQNGILLSDKEIKCNVPKYVREFDNSHPLVNISSEDHRIFNSKLDSLEKVMLIEKYRQILRYDFSLYSSSVYTISFL